MGSIIQMSANISGGTEDADAQIDVPFNCNLVGVKWSAMVDFDADLETLQVQLGFSSTFNGQNDSRSTIDMISARLNLTTSGADFASINQYTPIENLPLMGGERLFLNALSTAGVAGSIFCYLHLDRDMDQAMVRRR